jgi:hypothetical protein
MADVKISGLPASTVPLAGTEVLPIVQGGATKQVSIANVTAGRAIAATSITTDTYKAASSSGGALQNSGGTPQLQWGAGGGNNLSVDVAININPANAAVAISPTGTGTVAISPAGALTVNPTAASTMNNVAIGGTTATTGKFTTLEATGVTTVQAGTALLPAITTTGDTNTGIYFPAADTIGFTEGGVESMRIYASSGVSIGNTTDPGATNLSVTGLVSAVRFVPTGNVVPTNGMYLPSANILGFSTNTTEAARFDNNQNLLVGTTSTPAGTGGNIRAKYGFVQDNRAVYSGSKSLALSTATNFATFTNPNGGFNMCLKIRVNAYVAGAGADAFGGESSEWIVNYNTYGGTPQTPTLTRLNNQAWQSSAFITATYNLTASLSGNTMTLTATQTVSGAGAAVPTGATMFYSIENVMSTGANCIFTAL